MLLFINVYLFLMLPVVISVGKHLKEQNTKIIGFWSNFFLLIEIIINTPKWYIISIRELFNKKK